MKRKLSKEEAKLTEQGIKNAFKDIEDFKEKAELKQLARDAEIARRKFEDKLTPYNRKIEDANYETETKYIEDQIKMKEHSIKEMTKHLEEGVDIKKNSVVAE